MLLPICIYPPRRSVPLFQSCSYDVGLLRIGKPRFIQTAGIADKIFQTGTRLIGISEEQWRISFQYLHSEAVRGHLRHKNQLAIVSRSDVYSGKLCRRLRSCSPGILCGSHLQGHGIQEGAVAWLQKERSDPGDCCGSLPAWHPPEQRHRDRCCPSHHFQKYQLPYVHPSRGVLYQGGHREACGSCVRWRTEAGTSALLPSV